MQQFDTIKLSIGSNSIKSINTDLFKWTLAQGNDSKLYTSRIENLPIGVSSIKWLEGADMQLTFSAKILKDDYLTGLNVQNWNRCFEALSNIALFDENKVYDTATILSCDSTNNVLIHRINENPNNIYTSLLASRGNDKFLPQSYKSKHQHGIEFRGMHRTEKNRMIVYSKYLDLLKASNKNFMASLKNPTKLITTAGTQIRFETNHTTFNSLRKRFDVHNNSLKELLNSTAPVNHNFLKKIMAVGDVKQTKLFDEFLNYENTNDFLTYKGIETIIKELNYNDVSIKNFFKNIMNEDTFKYWYYKKSNSIKKVLETMQTNKHKIDKYKSNEIANKVLDELKKAVA